MVNAILIDDRDNVVSVIEQIRKGDDVNYETKESKLITLKALEDIPIYHKIAIRDIIKGSPVIKYGEHIGVAADNIKAGMHVHEHNVRSVRENL
ncbi:UxaA family hydrolase [Thermoanaerobacterium thermosaccharolyticum]|uniref:UxaA family hydrolase n=1 Tax=Thermoanaerobacterium thermosaccharolyticum TaxID=1517 RepID=UPI003DA9547A